MFGRIDTSTLPPFHTSMHTKVHRPDRAVPVGAFFHPQQYLYFTPLPQGQGSLRPASGVFLRSLPVVSSLRGFLPLFRPALSFVHRLLCRLGFSLFLPLVLLVPAFIVVDDVDGETQRELHNSPASCDGVLRNPKRNNAVCEGWIRRPRRGS